MISMNGQQKHELFSMKRLITWLEFILDSTNFFNYIEMKSFSGSGLSHDWQYRLYVRVYGIDKCYSFNKQFEGSPKYHVSVCFFYENMCT